MRYIVAALSCASLLAQCVTDDDCELNGVCDVNTGICACISGWIGPSCGELDLRPSSPVSGLRERFASTWCGTILPDDLQVGLWHMYASEMSHNCSLGVWLFGSQVVHATSTGDVTGPYQRLPDPVGVVIQPEAHNPQAIVTPDGMYLIFDSYGGPASGCVAGANLNCSSQHGGDPCGPKGPGPTNLTLHVSPTPRGPWSATNITLPLACSGLNLTPSPAFHPNGSIYLALHDCGARGDGLIMLTADTWNGSYRSVGDASTGLVWDPTTCLALGGWCEDPYLSIYARSDSDPPAWHIILHDSCHGLHLFSHDGHTFTTARNFSAPYPYPCTVNNSDGSSFTAGRRERPFIVRDAQGAPLALVTSMQATSVHPGTFTHVQPIGQGGAASHPRLQEEQGEWSHDAAGRARPQLSSTDAEHATGD